ncbi:MAG: BlaI/MecI/CopY family transcriptional regulator [Planctomycetes bacterium]|nr:BlaI/MecI/CopY family transcriptional regulator [Planctomycetota bacterium]
MKKLPRISDAEWTVMKVLWARPGLTADEVVEALQGQVTWNMRTIRTTHQDQHANLLRVSIRHTQTDRFLVARGNQVACDAREPGAAGLWEVRLEDGVGDDRDRIVYFYSVAARRYLTWNPDGNGVAPVTEKKRDLHCPQRCARR